MGLHKPMRKLYGAKAVNRVWGCQVKRGKDGLPYGYIRKKYTRTHPYPEHVNRHALWKREKTTTIMLRKKGYPMNMIAAFLGRSTSFVHRTLRTAIMRLCLRPIDMRKLPGKIRMRCSSIRWATLQKYWDAWSAFLMGVEDKPP